MQQSLMVERRHYVCDYLSHTSIILKLEIKLSSFERYSTDELLGETTEGNPT